MALQCEQSELPGVLIFTPDQYRDSRGFFMETFHVRKYQALGLGQPLVQDNCSSSSQGTLRGLHYQARRPQGKLVSVLAGAIFDVAVDIRRGSATFGRWVGVELSADNYRQLYVPEGYAHGFCVLSPTALVHYKCTEFYDATDDAGVLWSDPALGIAWPVAAPLLSAKDAALPRLSDIASERLPGGTVAGG